MRNLVIDFDLTVLMPLALFASIVLWNSVSGYLKSSTSYEALTNRLNGSFNTEEERQEVVDLRGNRYEEKSKTRRLIWPSIISLVVLCAVSLLPNRWEAFIALWTWTALSVVSMAAFIIAIPSGWHYATNHPKDLDWFRFWACVVVILMAATSIEHFFHERMNAQYVIFPHRDDDKSDGN